MTIQEVAAWLRANLANVGETVTMSDFSRAVFLSLIDVAEHADGVRRGEDWHIDKLDDGLHRLHEAVTTRPQHGGAKGGTDGE